MESSGRNAGQLTGTGGKEALGNPLGGGKPMPIEGMNSAGGGSGEKTGFVTSGYIDKRGTPYGEAAKFNVMPPGEDIENQPVAEINDLPMRRIVAGSFPGDGW